MMASSLLWTFFDLLLLLLGLLHLPIVDLLDQLGALKREKVPLGQSLARQGAKESQGCLAGQVRIRITASVKLPNTPSHTRGPRPFFGHAARALLRFPQK
jgi:hypothetical protein